MKSDEINAVELVRRIRDRQQEELQGKTAEERRAFYSERAKQLHERLGVKTREKKPA